MSQLTALVITLLVTQTAFAQQHGSTIRSIDFANFTYPYTSDLVWPRDRIKTFTLHNSKFLETKHRVGMSLANVSYGDVTGDGVEEAILYFGVHTNGSAAPGCVYIYTMRGKRARLLWAFDTGDRTDGGLRRVYAENGELVVELYGRGKIIGRDLYADDGTRAEVPYPYACTRTRYRWRGKRFRRVGKAEEFSDRSGSASPIFAR